MISATPDKLQSNDRYLTTDNLTSSIDTLSSKNSTDDVGYTCEVHKKFIRAKVLDKAYVS